MKYMISLVCLFFIVFSIPLYASEDYGIRLQELLKKEEQEDYKTLSKELNDLYIDLDQEINSISESIERNESLQEEYLLRITSFRKDKEAIRDSIPLYMQLYQYGTTSPILDFYCQTSDLFDRYEKQYEEIKDRIDKNKQVKEEYESYIQQILLCQERLFNKNYSYELKINGEYEREGVINGIKDLPIYGGFYHQIEANGNACLANGNYSLDSFSDSWILPILNGSISAGTWSYPSGDLHLGMDFACSMYSEVYAPANGLILYANAPVDSNNGYLGNWIGWPAGGGNTICMVCAVQDTLYAVTFAHLSNQLFVYPGQQVRQGDKLALSGNSGNSTGPHCHIEIFKCNESLDEVVSYFMQGADFSFGNGFDNPATCSQYACRIRPESVWR